MKLDSSSFGLKRAHTALRGDVSVGGGLGAGRRFGVTNYLKLSHVTFSFVTLRYENKEVDNMTVEVSYPDYTEEFYKCLHFDPQEVWMGSKKNRIKTMPVIILGTSGIGKTTMAMNIMKKVDNWYYGHGVCPVYTNEVSLGALMEYGLQTHRWLGERWKRLPEVYVLAFDDATAIEVKPPEVRRFFSIRHVVEELTGIKEGIVYSLFLTHDWYSLHKIFRRYGQIAAVLSVPPLDAFAKRQITKLLGETPVEILRDLYKKAMKEDKFKGTGFVKLPYVPEGQELDVGFIHFKEMDFGYVEIKPWERPEVWVEEVGAVRFVLHIPEEKKKEEDEDIVAKHEDQKRKTRERVRRYRARQKKRLEEALKE